MNPSLTRRAILSAAGAATLLRSSDRDSNIQLGCQTNAWPIHPQDPQTLFRALDSIKNLGFTGFETGFANILPQTNMTGFLGHTRDLTFFGIHIFLREYDPASSVAPRDLVGKVIEKAVSFNALMLILSGKPATSPQALQRKVEALNSLGRDAQSRGVMLAYHNHGPEFTGENPEIESLISGADSKLVSFLLDAGHAFRAGADPVAFINRHHDRLAGLHLRDFKDGKQVPLGSGDFPLANVAKALRQNRWNGWVLAEEEREDGTKPAESAAGPASIALHKVFGV